MCRDFDQSGPRVTERIMSLAYNVGAGAVGEGRQNGAEGNAHASKQVCCIRRRQGRGGATHRLELLVKFALMPHSWHQLALEIGLCFLWGAVWGWLLIQTLQCTSLSTAISCAADTFHVESWSHDKEKILRGIWRSVMWAVWALFNTHHKVILGGGLKYVASHLMTKI